MGYERGAATAAREGDAMTPDEMRDARGALGHMWGYGRPLTMREMGLVLRLRGKDPGASVRDYETGKTEISGPLSLAIEALLAGFRPPGWSPTLRR